MRAPSDRTISLFWFLAVCALCGWMVVVGWRFAAADFFSLEARHQIATWSAAGAKPIVESDWQRLHGQLSRAIESTPGNPMLHDYMAALYVIRAQSFLRDAPGVGRRLYELARQHQEISLSLRPSSGRTWASLASVQLALNAPQADLMESLRQAAFHSPMDPEVQKLVLPALLARWKAAPQELRDWVKRIYADEPTRRRLKMDVLLKAAGLVPQEL